MANYYATARSNYFAVRDEKAFSEWTALLGLTILEPSQPNQTADGVRRYAITPGDTGDGDGWPTSRYDEDTDELEDIDVSDQLSTHLADDEVAILMESGSEKLRYITAIATAVNNKGDTVRLSLESIYEAAQVLGPNITRAEY